MLTVLSLGTVGYGTFIVLRGVARPLYGMETAMLASRGPAQYDLQ